MQHLTKGDRLAQRCVSAFHACVLGMGFSLLGLALEPDASPWISGPARMSLLWGPLCFALCAALVPIARNARSGPALAHGAGMGLALAWLFSPAPQALAHPWLAAQSHPGFTLACALLGALWACMGLLGQRNARQQPIQALLTLPLDALNALAPPHAPLSASDGSGATEELSAEQLWERSAEAHEDAQELATLQWVCAKSFSLPSWSADERLVGRHRNGAWIAISALDRNETLGEPEAREHAALERNAWDAPAPVLRYALLFCWSPSLSPWKLLQGAGAQSPEALFERAVKGCAEFPGALLSRVNPESGF